MTLLKFPALFVTGICIAGLYVWQRQPPSRWQDIDADGQFSFSLPQGFTKTDKTGVEKYLGEYYRGETRLLFIWGDTASPAYRERRRPEMRGYQELTTRLKGKQANVRTYWLSQGGKRFYRAELNVGNWERGQVTLYMGVEGSDPATLETASKIFRSITFPNPIPEHSPGQGP